MVVAEIARENTIGATRVSVTQSSENIWETCPTHAGVNQWYWEMLIGPHGSQIPKSRR